jgi:hypothetical protein
MFEIMGVLGIVGVLIHLFPKTMLNDLMHVLYPWDD